jgi:hypothetical protein
MKSVWVLSCVALIQSLTATEYLVTHLEDGGDHSFREALLLAAHNKAQGPHQIQFDEHLQGTLMLQGHLPRVDASIEMIRAPLSSDITIHGSSSYHPFWIEPKSNITLFNLSIVEGRSQGGHGGDGYTGGGGAMGAGGALYIEEGAYVVLDSVTCSGCAAVGGHGGKGDLLQKASGGGGGMRQGAGGSLQPSSLSPIGGGGGGGLASKGGGGNGAGGGGGGDGFLGGAAPHRITLTAVGSGGGGGGALSPGKDGKLSAPGFGGHGQKGSSPIVTGGRGGWADAETCSTKGSSAPGAIHGSDGAPYTGGGGGGSLLLTVQEEGFGGQGGAGGVKGGGGGGGGVVATQISPNLQGGSGGRGGKFGLI